MEEQRPRIIGQDQKDKKAEKPKLDVSRAIAKRWERYRRSIWFRLLKSAFLFGIVILVFYLLINLNLFFVVNIKVQGFDEGELTYIQSEEVENHLVDYIGKRLFKIDPDEVEESVLGVFPFADEVYVSKRFPDTLVVRIIEKSPVLSINNNMNQQMLLSTDAVILDDCENRVMLCKELPACHASSIQEELEPGDALYFEELDDVLRLEGLLSEAELEVVSYMVPESKVIVVEFKDKTRAIFSTKKPVEAQFEDFLQTQENLRLEGKTYKELDFRFDRPVMRVDKYTEWVIE